MTTPILVTGGAGFIGSNFVLRWSRRGGAGTLVVLDKLTYAADPRRIQGLPGVTLVAGDIQDLPLVEGLLREHGIQTIVHFAAESHVDNSIAAPEQFVRTNVLGTFALLEAARRCWEREAPCKFLHVSTDEVYGSLGPEGAFTETSPYAPNSPYSATKAGSDHLARAYHHTYGLPVLVTHCSNNYGPGQFREKLIPLAIDRMARNLPVPVYGDGQQERDWLHVDDHCAALEAVLADGHAGETFAIGGNQPLRNLDLLESLADAVDRRLGRTLGTSRSLLTFVADRPGHDRRYAIDPARIMARLGWTPSIPFREGLESTVAHYLP